MQLSIPSEVYYFADHGAHYHKLGLPDTWLVTV
jgi:hypothetical protein